MPGRGCSSSACIAFFTISVSVRTDGEVFFLNLRNIQSILNTIVPVLLMGLGQTFVIISGGIDLSVGWVMGLSSVVSARSTLILVDAGLGEFAAIAIGFVVALGVASMVGLISGIIIAKLRVPSFIVTLGMAFVARGAALMISGGNTVGDLPQGMRTFGNESLLYWIPGEGGGLPFLEQARRHRRSAAEHGSRLPLAGGGHRGHGADRDLPAAQDTVRSSHLRHRRQP